MERPFKKEPSSQEKGSSFFNKCLDQALVYLSMRDHNRRELETKLRTKDYDKETIKKVLDSLEEDGSLSEERYVRSFVNSSNRRHPEGKTVLSKRLAAKGADREVARDVLNGIYTPEYTADLVRRARSEIERKGKATSDEQVRFLLMKAGFSSSDIRLAD